MRPHKEVTSWVRYFWSFYWSTNHSDSIASHSLQIGCIFVVVHLLVVWLVQYVTKDIEDAPDGTTKGLMVGFICLVLLFIVFFSLWD